MLLLAGHGHTAKVTKTTAPKTKAELEVIELRKQLAKLKKTKSINSTKKTKKK